MSKSTRTSRSWPILCCLLLGSFLGCRQKPPAAEETAPPATVKWEGLSNTVLEQWTELVGTTVPLPDRVAHVSAAVPGQVVEIFGDPEKSTVTEGQPVKKGTPLVRLNTSVIAANVAKANASLKSLAPQNRPRSLARPDPQVGRVPASGKRSFWSYEATVGRGLARYAVCRNLDEFCPIA